MVASRLAAIPLWFLAVSICECLVIFFLLQRRSPAYSLDTPNNPTCEKSSLTGAPQPPVFFSPEFRPIKALFLTDYKLNYQSGMDRHFFSFHKAALKSPYFSAAVLWGVGFPGYDNSATLEQNLLARYNGSLYFDLMVLYANVPNSEVIALSDRIVVALREHECFELRCQEYINMNNASLIMLTYANEIDAYSRLPSNSHRLFVHTPQPARFDYFYEPKVGIRTKQGFFKHDVMLAGSISPLYPLRQRWKHILPYIRNSYVYDHPGYWDYAATAAKMESQLEYFAFELRKTKILVLDSSTFKYQLQKFAEGLLAGALLISDLPYQDDEFWEQVVIPIDSTMGEKKMLEIVEWWLAHDEEREAHVARAQALGLAKYTYDTSVALMAKGYYKLKHQDQHGAWYPFPYSVGCAALNRDGAKNAWC